MILMKIVSASATTFNYIENDRFIFLQQNYRDLGLSSIDSINWLSQVCFFTIWFVWTAFWKLISIQFNLVKRHTICSNIFAYFAQFLTKRMNLIKFECAKSERGVGLSWGITLSSHFSNLSLEYCFTWELSHLSNLSIEYNLSFESILE